MARWAVACIKSCSISIFLMWNALKFLFLWSSVIHYFICHCWIVLQWPTPIPSLFYISILPPTMWKLYFSLPCHLQEVKGKQLHTVNMYGYFCWVFVLPPIQQLEWSCKGAGEQNLSLCSSLYQAAHLWTEISGFTAFVRMPVWHSKQTNEQINGNQTNSHFQLGEVWCFIVIHFYPASS